MSNDILQALVGHELEETIEIYTDAAGNDWAFRVTTAKNDNTPIQ